MTSVVAWLDTDDDERRRGELRALRWRDVDFSKRLIHVRRAFASGREDTPKSDRAPCR